ncbi:MAG: hypothetical protein ACXVH3_33820 [Solirubrobacteraceae bacterium]
MPGRRNAGESGVDDSAEHKAAAAPPAVALPASGTEAATLLARTLRAARDGIAGECHGCVG